MNLFSVVQYSVQALKNALHFTFTYVILWANNWMKSNRKHCFMHHLQTKDVWFSLSGCKAKMHSSAQLTLFTKKNAQ